MIFDRNAFSIYEKLLPCTIHVENKVATAVAEKRDIEELLEVKTFHKRATIKYVLYVAKPRYSLLSSSAFAQKDFLVSLN